MCGILAYIIKNNNITVDFELFMTNLKKIIHRGSDAQNHLILNSYKDNNNTHIGIGHNRLAIVGDNTSQPFRYNKRTLKNDEYECSEIILAVNGEIYNYRDLVKKYNLYKYLEKNNKTIDTMSDCEIIYYLMIIYNSDVTQFINELYGMFAFIIYFPKEDRLIIGRDEIGIIPLYIGTDNKDYWWISSEMKSICDICPNITQFHPGTIYEVNQQGKINILNYNKLINRQIECYISDLTNSDNNNEINEIYNNIKSLLTDSVIHHIKQCNSVISNTDIHSGTELKVSENIDKRQNIGILLSGGLDSSLVLSITNQNVMNVNLHIFSIGNLENSPDVINAKQIVTYLEKQMITKLNNNKIIHHIMNFDIEEALNLINNVIYHIETYDITTVRASIPMYIIAHYINNLNTKFIENGENVIKWVLSGEGADELFGGYSYFKYAPNDIELQQELITKVTNLHHYDCLRANKSMMAFGIEVRVPFLYTPFIHYVMNIHPKYKQYKFGNIEKFILRNSFTRKKYRNDIHNAMLDNTLFTKIQNNDIELPISYILPADILFRKKEQFSDGVGYGWISYLKKNYNEKEYYENIYNNLFCTVYNHYNTVMATKSIACSSQTALNWMSSEFDINNADPSGLLDNSKNIS